MDGLKIAITGSYRKAEEEKYGFIGDENYFAEKSKLLGKCLAENRATLVASWSNDYLSMQLDISNGDIKYKFEDTAEYHAMYGYILNNGPQVILYISQRLYSLFELYLSIKYRYLDNMNILSKLSSDLFVIQDLDKNKDANVSYLNDKDIEKKINCLLQNEKISSQNAIEKTYLGYLLQKPEEIFIETLMKKSSNVEIRIKIPDDELRSPMLENYVVKNSEAVVFIGGGKATNSAAKEAMATHKFIFPFPEFGGKAYVYLRNLKPPRDLKENSNVTPDCKAVENYADYIPYCNKYSNCFRKITEDTVIEDTPDFFSYVKNVIDMAMDTHTNEEPVINEKPVIKEEIKLIIRFSESIQMCIPGPVGAGISGSAEAQYIVTIPVEFLPSKLKEELPKYTTSKYMTDKAIDFSKLPVKTKNKLTKFIKHNQKTGHKLKLERKK